MRLLRNVLTVTIAAVVVSVGAITAPAHAAYGCSGTLVGTYPVKELTISNPKTYGNIHVYYSSANGGTNCAVNVATSAGGYGTRKFMDVKIHLCLEITRGSKCTPAVDDYDGGDFLYYAGPVRVTSTAGRCIAVDAYIKYNGQYAAGSTSPLATHCG